MNKQRHLIKKQIIELNLSSQQGAFELQNEVSRIYRYKIIPLIDDLLSQFSHSDTIYRINSLEINLGNIDINNLEQEFIDKFIEQIKQQLAEKISRSSSSYAAEPQPNLDLNDSSSQFRTTEVLSDKNGNKKAAKNIENNHVISFPKTQSARPSNQNMISEIASKRGSQLEILSYFIQTGILPWWSEKLSKQQLEEYCDHLIETSPNQMKSMIGQSLKNEKQLQRIIYQFSDAILLKIAGLFASNLVHFIDEYNTNIKFIFKQLDRTKSISETKLRLEIWQRILFTVSSPGNIKLDKSELIQANLLQIATENIISEIASKKGSQLEILSYFIQTGILPWWSEKLSKQQLEEYCDHLIETSPNQMKSMIGQSLKNEKQLQRIIYQFSDAILLKIAGLFASNLVHFIDEYNTNIKFIFKQLDRTKSISENKLRLEIWQRILFTVSSPGNIELDKSELIQANLLQIATENIISEIATKKGSQLEILNYFIQTGILPWWSEKLSKQQLEEYCDRLIETSPNQIQRLVENSIKDERQLRRIIFQFSEPTLLKIAELMADNLSAFLFDYLIVINKTLKRSDLTATRIPENRLKWELWRGILLSLYEKGNHPPDPPQLIAENLLYLATRLPCEYPRLLRQAIKTIASVKTEGQSFRSSLPEELVKLSDRHPTQLQSPNHSETPSQVWEPFPHAIAPFSNSEEIYIDNAGLILLWPFLNRFFSQLRLVEQNCFVNDEAAERAALLLQYLVDASVDPPEHLLPLNKILCGIELLDPTDTHLDIIEAERSECENLLSAVIQNWSILKNTSIAGFRQAFLQRNGILKVCNGEWLLQVERETYDILLDRIPWSIRVVKLPWMDHILYIEW